MTMATAAEFKQHIGIKGPDDDALIARLLGTVETHVLNYLNRPWLNPAQVFAEKQDGRNTDYLLLHYWPLRTISSVTIGTVVLASTDYEIGSDGTNDSRILYLLNGKRFSRGRRNIVVQGTAGFDACPEDVKQAQIEVVALRYNERKRLGEAGRTIEGTTVSYIQKEFTKAAGGALENYRNRIPA